MAGSIIKSSRGSIAKLPPEGVRGVLGPWISIGRCGLERGSEREMPPAGTAVPATSDMNGGDETHRRSPIQRYSARIVEGEVPKEIEREGELT